MKSKNLKIKNNVILIGYNKEDKCIYSEATCVDEYYDGTHLWDDNKNVKKIELYKLKGYIFNSNGVLEQEFVSVFDLETGCYKSGESKFSDGTIQKD
jgi:hypothetical protein